MELRYNTAGPKLTIEANENTSHAWLLILRTAVDTLQERIKEQAPAGPVKDEFLDRLIEIDQYVWD